MERKNFIQVKLREGIDVHKKETIVMALLNKAANDLYNSYRHLEMACEHSDDMELRRKIESVKMLLGQEVEISGDFDDGYSSSVINSLKSILDTKEDF